MRAHAFIGHRKRAVAVDNLLRLFDLIVELARHRYQMAERAFSALGLNHTEARLLTLLYEEGGAATQEALSNMLFVDRSNAGRALKNLEQKGYLERCKDDGDKRTNLVHITAKGGEAFTEISKLKNKMAQSFFGDLTNEEAGAIVETLRKVIKNDEGE